MSSPTLRYSKKSNLRVRPMAEWQGLMVFAPGQSRGSVVIIPSTSVQISMRSASSAAPMIAAE